MVKFVNCRDYLIEVIHFWQTIFFWRDIVAQVIPESVARDGKVQ